MALDVSCEIDGSRYYNVLEHDVTILSFSSPHSIMNSLVIVLFLSGMVAMIMLRTLHKDIARYNQMDTVSKQSIGSRKHLKFRCSSSL